MLGGVLEGRFLTVSSPPVPDAFRGWTKCARTRLKYVIAEGSCRMRWVRRQEDRLRVWVWTPEKACRAAFVMLSAPVTILLRCHLGRQRKSSAKVV